MEIDSAEFIERTNFEEEESKLSRTFFMFVYSVVFHFDEILFLYFTIPAPWYQLVLVPSEIGRLCADLFKRVFPWLKSYAP